MIEQGSLNKLWELIHDGFRAFVGMTAFEELCRDWTLSQSHSGKLPLSAQIVGKEWSKDTQIDVMAIDWKEKEMFVDECKWGARPVGRAVLRELINKTPFVAPGPDWRVYYALFARSGFTGPTRVEAEKFNAILVDLEALDTDLRSTLVG